MRTIVVTGCPRADLAAVDELAWARTEKENHTREALRSGKLGLDLYGLRQGLVELGVEYVDYESYREAP